MEEVKTFATARCNIKNRREMRARGGRMKNKHGNIPSPLPSLPPSFLFVRN